MTTEQNIWSYSRLTSYEQCPYSFYLKYIEEREGVSNSWADVGTFCHDILEQVARGEMPVEATADYFEENYPPTNFPELSSKYDYGEKLKSELLDFFNSFEGLEGVLSVEREFLLDLPNGDKLRGFIDNETMEVVGDVEHFHCIDYKISNPFAKKDMVKKVRQLYVYAEAMFQEYKQYPEDMTFWFLKAQKKLTIKFDMAARDETFEWIMNTIETIGGDETWEAKPDFFFCHRICSYRDTCEFKA